jgi:hypothetical protein
LRITFWDFELGDVELWGVEVLDELRFELRDVVP